MSDLSQNLANLTPEELARLSGRLKQRMKASGSSQAIRREAQPSTAPLSFAQQQLWFLQQLDPHDTTYHISEIIQLTGSLDVPRLEQCFLTILERHEILRSAFSLEGEQPVQRSVPLEPWRMELFDLRHLPEQERRAEGLRLAHEIDAQPFDLTKPPLLRAALVRLHPEGTRPEHLLLLTMHHIVSDGWSLGVLLHELRVLYAAYISGRPHPTSNDLPELPIQYADAARWQHQKLQGRALAELLAYWTQQLDGMPTDSPLPADTTNLAQIPSRGAHVSFVISGEMKQALQASAAAEGATLFMILLAAFNVLLHYVSRREDIVVGTDVANRTRVETEPLIGLFVNQLVLRTKLHPKLSFRECLQRTREVTLGAYAHQDLPFQRLVEAVAPARSLARNPLFQVLFVLQNTPMPPVDLPGITLRLMTVELETQTAPFDLSMLLSEQGESLLGVARYRTALFEQSTIRRIIYLLQETLKLVVTNPDITLDQLDELLRSAEEQYRQQEMQQLKRTQRQGLDRLRKGRAG